MSNLDVKNTIASRVARLLEKNTVVNVGIGIPTLVVNHVGAEQNVTFHTENGILGLGGIATEENQDMDIFDPGSNYVTLVPGGTFLDSATSFGLVRGGHIDVTILGALQVDAKGNLANWMIPDSMIAGFGGAIDLVTCVPTVIVAMEHVSKGKPKILKECTFPLTGVNCVDYIVTEMGLMQITETGIVLRELREGVSVADIQGLTDVELIIPETPKTMACVFFENG